MHWKLREMRAVVKRLNKSPSILCLKTSPSPWLVFWTVTFSIVKGPTELVTFTPLSLHLKMFVSAMTSGFSRFSINTPVTQSIIVTFANSGAFLRAFIPWTAWAMSTFSRYRRLSSSDELFGVKVIPFQRTAFSRKGSNVSHSIPTSR